VGFKIQNSRFKILFRLSGPSGLISFELSAFGFELSAFGFELSALSFTLLPTACLP
jgi:hypothetical protein